MSNDNIRVAIIGVGNCSSSLVQGIEYYGNNEQETDGLMIPDIGGYRPGDIEIAFGVDVDETKVGKDVSEAIFSETNNATKYVDVPNLDAPVYRGPELDGFTALHNEQMGGTELEVSEGEHVGFWEKLKEYDVDVAINYLPTGSREATSWYMTECLDAGVGVMNAIPEFIASSENWTERFEEAGVPIVGDDIKSAVGASIVHRTLVDLFERRGVTTSATSQLNVGGNSDFLNLTQADRLKSKLISKTETVKSQSQTDELENDENIHVSPSGYVGFLEDTKWAHMYLRGEGFLGAPYEIDLKLSVEDSPNSGAVAIDGVRAAKLAMDRGESGPVIPASQWCCKTPPKECTDTQAHQNLMEWIEGQ